MRVAGEVHTVGNIGESEALIIQELYYLKGLHRNKFAFQILETMN
jgi:hypothetical protein